MKTLTPREKVAGLLQKGPLLQWLRQQNPRGRHNYLDEANCCLARYLKANGFSQVRFCSRSVRVEGMDGAFWFDIDIASAVQIGRTFGGVIAELEEMV